jgi:hypothetical protein
MPFIMRATESGEWPTRDSAACSGGSAASACDAASGVSFTRMAFTSPVDIVSSSRISGRAASASTVNGLPTTAS